MNKRKLKRQLNLVQVVMLGTAGAIGAQIFVLTGHAAGMIGPAFVLAIILGGVLSYSIALNYGELASSFPETGGAMTYVREAWGRNLLSYLVGSLDCLSSTFYAALSAIGFAYSLQIFFPSLPIVPIAIGIILVFVVLNILGVGNIGNIQILLGGTLLFVLLAYIVLGLSLPGGFQWSTFLSGGKFFIYDGGWENFYRLLSTIALAYVAYIGFEVIADDAEEIKDPDRAIPLGILVSLTLLLIIYPMIILVTLGTVSWQELAGSETALTDAVVRFLPQWGPATLGVTGIIATITSLNTAMLSATREAFTLSRDGMWPRFLSRLGRFRTPYAAALVIGLIIIAVASVGLVEFLSYISSSGYLFVLFWSNLTLIRLRKRYPNLHRPFKVPFYPITVYLAIGTCLLIISFTDLRALGFGAGLLGVLTVAYYLSPAVNQIYITHISSVEKNKDRILVPIANPKSGAHLVRMATILARA
ncbi:MAG TPA: amino acid permease, partial [Anaerolineales bacterium]|nr:amino acid permease [Anaerolineales bacterium]